MASPHTVLTKFLSLALRRYCLCTERGSHHIIMIFYHDVTAQPQCGPWIPLHGYNIVSREISALRPPCHLDSAVALPSALRPPPCGAHADGGMLGCGPSRAGDGLRAANGLGAARAWPRAGRSHP